VPATTITNREIKEKVVKLLDAGVDLDEIITLEAEMLAESIPLPSRSGSLEARAILLRIQSHTIQNSERLNEVNDLLSQLQ